MKNNKRNFLAFVIVFVVVSFLLFIYLANPYSFSKNTFNDSHESSNTDHLEINSDYDIARFIQEKDFLTNVAIDMERRGEISTTQMYLISDNYRDAEQSLNEYKSGGDRQVLFKSLFYAQLSLNYRESFPFLNCAERVINLSEKYSPFFFYLNYEDHDRISKIEKAKKRVENYLEYSSRRENIDRNDSLIRLAEEGMNFDKTFPEINEIRCESFETYLNKDYSWQKYLYFLKLGTLMILSIGFFMLGKFITIKNFIWVMKKISSLGDGMSSMWSPKEVKRETIKSILKVNSVTSALLAFLALSLKISGLNNFFIVGLIMVSIFSLLGSILVGIIALNSGEPKAEIACYRLFIFGLAMFIIFFLTAIISGGLVAVLSNMSEAVKVWANNQTIGP